MTTACGLSRAAQGRRAQRLPARACWSASYASAAGAARPDFPSACKELRQCLRSPDSAAAASAGCRCSASDLRGSARARFSSLSGAFGELDAPWASAQRCTQMGRGTDRTTLPPDPVPEFLRRFFFFPFSAKLRFSARENAGPVACAGCLIPGRTSLEVVIVTQLCCALLLWQPETDSGGWRYKRPRL